MQWTTLSLTICLAGAAQAGSILDFSLADLGPSEILMPDTYGDRLPGTPNIDMSYYNVDYTPQTFGPITGLAAGHTPSFFSAQIIFTPDPGYGVELISLDMGNYQGNVIQRIDLLDGNDIQLVNLEPSAPFYFGGSRHYTPDYFQPGVLKLDFADNFYIGFNNIQFAQFQIQSTGVPEPGTFSVLGLGLIWLGWRRKRR